MEQRIAAATGEPFAPSRRAPLGGGCISQAWRVGDGAREFFVKVNAAAGLAMFQAEAAGLAELAATRTVRVPGPVCFKALRKLPDSQQSITATTSLGK